MRQNELIKRRAELNPQEHYIQEKRLYNIKYLPLSMRFLESIEFM